MKHIFWLKKGLLAGRSGPNKDPWDLPAMKKEGIHGILSVNGAEMVDKELMKEAGIAYAHIPMSDNSPALKGDKALCLANLPKALHFIRENMATGPVVVHCRSGKDRTGLVLAASLIVFDKKSAKEAIKEVLSVRPIAFTAEGWHEFSQDVLTDFSREC